LQCSQTSLAGSILVSTTRIFGSCHSWLTSDNSCLLTWSAPQQNTRMRLAPRQNQRTRARVIGLISRDDLKRYRDAGADQVALLIRGGRMTRSQHLFDLLDLRLGPARRQLEPSAATVTFRHSEQGDVGTALPGLAARRPHGTDQLTDSAKTSGDPELHGRVIPSASKL
jgi:hypothetical protein